MKKGLSINEMGHHMNVECAVDSEEKENASDMAGFCAHDPLSGTKEEIGHPNLQIKRLYEKSDQQMAHCSL